MTLLEIVRANIRLTTDKLDEAEIQPIIDACKLDMRISGVVKIEESDPLVVRAHIWYAKANFGYDDKADKHQKRYESLRDSMAQSGLYAGDADV